MSARTPGPWYIVSDTDIATQAGSFVASTHDSASDIGTAAEYANASFIAKACNAHDALVAALRNLADHASEMTWEDVERTARAALKMVQS